MMKVTKKLDINKLAHEALSENNPAAIATIETLLAAGKTPREIGEMYEDDAPLLFIVAEQAAHYISREMCA